MATAVAATVSGVGSATGTVAWSGSTAKRTRINWLPPASTPLLLDDGKTMAPVWYRAMQELFENRLGGINAQTLPQVATTQTQTQEQVLAVSATVQVVGTQLSSVTDAVNTTTQVAVDNSLTGATSIPPVPSYRYAAQ